MKKAVIYLSLILLVGVLSCRRVEKKQTVMSSDEEDTIALVDTQQEAAEEAAIAEAEQAAAEQARQDSINEEIKMRLNPALFRDFFNEKRMKRDLKAKGFNLIDEEYEKYEDFDSYWAKYKRTLNGRSIEIEFGYDTSNGGTIKFSDKSDFDQFKKDLLNSGWRKDEYGMYNHKNLNSNNPSFEIEGKNTITFGYY